MNKSREALQAEIDSLQEEFYRDESFLKEKIKEKDLAIEILEHNLESNKHLIQSLQKRVDLSESKIKEALNTVYAMKGKADCDHLTQKEQDFIYGFGYELHEILKGGDK